MSQLIKTPTEVYWKREKNLTKKIKGKQQMNKYFFTEKT